VSKLPRITAREAERALTKLGYVLVRQSGSHKIYKNKEGKRATIPYHAGKILHPKIIKELIQDSGITVEEFRDLL
jgi:predicted RNA binding protein YcfA (HicA-like mRNA interferase family)